MIRILITGSDSYVGNKVSEYILNKSEDIVIDQMDVQNDSWKENDFSIYDVVYHVAGLAHRKITTQIEPFYYEVNRDLTIEIAKKAKAEGVHHFIFMSSMSVYSDHCTVINKNTTTNPDNAYGKSKLQAENGIKELACESFMISILRPPMIYGSDCKGNYNSLRKIALKSPAFPLVDNKRSMIYIDNLAEFIYQLIVTKKSGLFFPQNDDLVNTSIWVKCIAAANGRTIHLSRVLGFFARVGKHIPGISYYCTKAFGDSYYLLEMSSINDIDYQLVGFEDSIIATEEHYCS